MSCEDTFPAIIKGEDKNLVLKFTDENGDLLDLTTITEINAKFAKSDGSILERKLSLTEVSVLSALGGKIQVTLTDANTALLKSGQRQSFTVVLDFGATRRVVNFNNALDVFDPAVS